MKLEHDQSSLPSPDVRDVVEDVSASLQETAEEVVPWFMENMPLVYFQDTERSVQLSHLRAIIAAKASGLPIELTLRNEDGSEWTSMRPQDNPGVLAELVSELPHDRTLRAAKIHTADDGKLVLDTFEFGEAAPFDPSDPKQAECLRECVEYAATHDPPVSEAEITEHFHRCSAEYILTVTPLRLCHQLELYRRLAGTDGTAVVLEPESDPSESRIVVAAGNATTRRMLERIATRLAFSEINIHRAYLDVVDDPPHGSISMLGFVVQAPGGGPIKEKSALWAEVRRDLLRNKWVEHRTLQLAYRNPSLGIERAEILTALADLAHQVLVKHNLYAFSAERIHLLMEREIDHAARIADLFLARFDPSAPLDDDAMAQAVKEIQHAIDNDVDLEDARTILTRLLRLLQGVLRTNVYIEERYALGMRLAPALLTTDERPEVPYGVFYVHGRGFNGFHVRFRDIARGGLRVIRTRSEEQHALENERLYDEAYNLAFAQQLKNKDIPEGGAKAAVLLDPYARLDRGVKGFVDTLLDLITPEEKTRSRIVDYFGADELLYLGPDENITPPFIEWIVDRAHRREYPLPTALMSSKPGAGINHKEYGVTSEGVNVFLDVALRAVGIEPEKQPFTIKMTGGPDGDVGGNLIRILNRDYGENARIVGIADGSGCGEDPDGLDLHELLRLQQESLPIASFDRDKVGPKGRVTAIDEHDGVHLRNTLHNRVVADAFVPCGGRPNAIHARNWGDFLGDDGKPSARVIVEGANLFLTPEARQELSDHDILILKDSSANKCGVITSSYEIISNMLLDEEEFLKIKARFVDEVLQKLRELARREAELLVRAHRHHPHVPMPVTSTRLSRVMIRTADAIESAIEELESKDQGLVRQLVIDHLPPVLVEVAGDRIWQQTPAAYLNWLMAKTLAARIVYREGFEYLEPMPQAAIAELALRFLCIELDHENLARQVEESELPDREHIAQVLRQAGILSSLGED
ncbi:MAG: NAD-glutamate dehydrogenase domain-containing protein [Planctomycetota bacterium]|jgi:glutamate dehydrogenase